MVKTGAMRRRRKAKPSILVHRRTDQFKDLVKLVRASHARIAKEVEVKVEINAQP